VRRAGGSIINTGRSRDELAAGVAGNFAHAAMKGSVIAMTRELALEGGRVGIRANSISPG